MRAESTPRHTTIRRRPPTPAAVACALLCMGVGADTARRPQAPPPAGRGVVVESAPAQSGFTAGDLLHSWVRAPRPPANPTEAPGAINSPFDLYIVEREQGQRGVVTLFGSRGTEPISAAMPSAESTLPSVDWRVTVRPQMSAATLAAYREGLELASAKQPLEAAARWRRLATEAGGEGAELASWLFYAAATVLSSGLARDAIPDYVAAERLATEANQTLVAAFIANRAGRALEDSRDLAGATESYGRAADLLTPIGESMFLARALLDVGSVASELEDYPRAEEAFERSLRIRETFSPASRALATVLNNAGSVAHKLGAMARAHALNRRALEILERLLPGSLQVATVLNNAATAAMDAGDLEAAEELLRRSLAIRDRLDPGGRSVALALVNLGGVHNRRDDLAAAHDLYSRALEIFEKVAPESSGVEAALMNLGTVASARGDFNEAEALYRRALAVAERAAPGSPRVAIILSNLGKTALRRKNLEQATELLQRAVEIAEKAAPRSRQLAASLLSLSSATKEKGDLKEAEHLNRRALDIYATVAPGSDGEARASYELAGLTRQAGRLREAAGLYERAVTAFESAAGRLGGDDEARARFGAERVSVYADYIDLLHDLGDERRAFNLLERSRAASLRRMMAERDILSGEGDLPPDLVRHRQQINAEYDRVQARMEALPHTDSVALQRAAARMRELRSEREQIIQRVRKASPRLAAVQYPQPLALDGVRQRLDAGTVLLAYSVGAERTLLFVVRPATSGSAALRVFALPIGSGQLRDAVTHFRRTIERQLADPHVVAGRRLYDLLIAPAEGLMTSSARVLIAPDGPLHGLPFAALVRPDKSAEPKATRYFAAWKPLHVTASATVYAEVTDAARRPRKNQTVAAFGDPVLPVPVRADADRARGSAAPDLLRRGYELGPLPSSRREVERIVELYPRTASAYLAAEATEERVKEVAARASYLHFATHGLLDEKFPLDSGLVLTRTPETAGQQTAGRRDNGLLQAWEIFDQMRLNADLVVLSACDTALGVEMGGEGLLGLSRAFQYAGARSVLASLWSVADESTADLMDRFYRHIKAGHSKDVALQKAQVELSRNAGTAHPFHWAAFTLSGDWLDGARR
jgi:CHAT domain-containing protein/Tfp pilus assembly protein PilF